LPTNEDPFVKGIEEWISFAEAIHGDQRKANQRAVGDEKNSA
jgi:hypothetical protein